MSRDPEPVEGCLFCRKRTRENAQKTRKKHVKKRVFFETGEEKALKALKVFFRRGGFSGEFRVRWGANGGILERAGRLEGR
jgi:hypothetical protein